MAEQVLSVVSLTILAMAILNIGVSSGKGAGKTLNSDCYDVKTATPSAQSGVYTVYPTNNANIPISVFCNMTTAGGPWTVLQRRRDGSQSFFLPYDQYVNGFGNITNEFWLGLQTQSALTNTRAYKLLIEMSDFSGVFGTAAYSNFAVGSNAANFKLTVSGYSGSSAIGDSLAQQNNMQFTTFDQDNDLSSGSNCAQSYKGGWWYNACHTSNLNGLYFWGPTQSSGTYGEGINWYTWHGYTYSLKTVEMKIARA